MEITKINAVCYTKFAALIAVKDSPQRLINFHLIKSDLK
jgi:hypothetical protein